jgi:hypothetical protein
MGEKSKSFGDKLHNIVISCLLSDLSKQGTNMLVICGPREKTAIELILRLQNILRVLNPNTVEDTEKPASGDALVHQVTIRQKGIGECLFSRDNRCLFISKSKAL